MNNVERPTIYEINAATFLAEFGPSATFGDVPDVAWDEIAALPIDAVWFMGVWQRSPAAKILGKENTELKTALPDLRDEDILGSAYSIHDYVVDSRFGGNDGLAVARGKLNERGVGLILDYVPNHVALDHVWTDNHADYFLPGSAEELQHDPGAFVQRPAGILAKGKDPNFAPWSDVVQLNAFSSTLRQAVTDTLTTISDMCDGVRCDMAMLMMNEVFTTTWGARAGDVPSDDYWPPIIAAVRQHNPNFLFIAEVYWGKEPALLNQGFNFCYDKGLYDNLVAGSAKQVKQTLGQDVGYQKHLLRFIENHDEPRAATAFSIEQQKAAAVVMATVEGAHLYHRGQFEGFRVRVPVHLARGPQETPDAALRDFYERLLSAEHHMRQPGSVWQVTKFATTLGLTSKQVMAWQWTADSQRFVVVVNFSDKPARGRLRLVDNSHETVEIVLPEEGLEGVLPRLLAGKSVVLEPWQHLIVRLQ